MPTIHSSVPRWRDITGFRYHPTAKIGDGLTACGSMAAAAFWEWQLFWPANPAHRAPSPILRGNWVYETLLGERLPRPPANVPQLPEAVPSGLTARQLIERHSSDATCAKCHVRIDPFGFALEQYDAIGRLRPESVDTKTTLFEGPTIDGISGLRDYLLRDRRDDVVRQFCRKLLGYALGRELHLADEPLLRHLVEQLAAHDYRFSVAIETIVASQQFREVRGQDEIDPSFEL